MPFTCTDTQQPRGAADPSLWGCTPQRQWEEQPLALRGAQSPQHALNLSLSPLQVPFTVLQGEGVEYLGHANDAVIAISNYRLHIKFKDSVINVSLDLPILSS